MDASGITFENNFSKDGEERLREKVSEKLKEFMGGYTDAALVDYVILLLRGRSQRDGMRRKLDLFLEHNSEAFVSWLWDHLTSSLHLYVQSSGEAGVKGDAKEIPSGDTARVGSESLLDSEKEKSSKSKTRHNREWKGIANDDNKPLILRSTINDDNRISHRHQSPVNASSSPKPHIQRKRTWADGESALKREEAPKHPKLDASTRPMLDSPTRPKLDAPRRLLQFAVRDAVRTVQKVPSRPEPSFKRLRSVVSSPSANVYSDEQPWRTMPVGITAGAAASAVKAAAEAAKDVVKSRGSGNVFDRLTHGSGEYTYVKNQADVAENEDDENFIQNSRSLEYEQKNEKNRLGRDTRLTRHTVMSEESADLISDFGSENDDYDNIGSLDGLNERSQIAEVLSLRKDNDAIMTEKSTVQTTNENLNATLRSDPKLHPIMGTNASQKTLNISINVNTWKPPNYQVPGQCQEVQSEAAVQGKSEDTMKLDTQLIMDTSIQKKIVKDTDVDAPVKEETAHRGNPNGAQKPVPSSHGAYSGGRPADDADLRTVFVSNVHFAATKDTLSRHFNKFGDVLKVIIVTDATTGQPKGSAYVEFLRKESAELALSLNGTSFMSRILKVVMRSAAHHEATTKMAWPRVARSAYPSRLGRMPYPRGLVAASLRARLPVKPGPRSLQWKRDNPGASTSGNLQSSQDPSTPRNAVISPAGRSLTYVRPETN